MPLRSPLLLLWFALSCCSPHQALAQTATVGTRNFEATHARKVAGNPPGLWLQIRTDSGATSVAMGELVTLVLEFTDQDGSRYDFDASPLRDDRVRAWPDEAVTDARVDHRHAIGLGMIGGGLGSIPAPLTGVHELRLDVNERIRFTQPGSYLLYVESARFLDRRAAQPRLRAVTVTSNLLALTVRPERIDETAIATWSARQLRHADTPGSVGELVRRLSQSTESASRMGTNAYHLARGLYATSHHTLALDAVRRHLATFSGVMNDEVPRVAATLETMRLHPRAVAPRPPPHSEPRDAIFARMRTYQCQLTTYQQTALAAGLRGSPEDIAHAAATFAATFAVNEVPPDCSLGASPDIARVMPPVFHHLSVKQQRAMLAWQWGLIAGDGMLPVLRALVAEAGTASSEIRDLALVRLGELAPEEAWRVSYDDVVTGRFRFGARALRLGDEDGATIAAQVAPWLAARLHDRPPSLLLHDGQRLAARGVLPLLARLGTADELDQVLAALTPMPAACAIRTTAAAYALRVQPHRGAALLTSLVNDAASRCGESMLAELAREWPQLVPEPLAIDALNHANRRVAAGAATALARIGGQAARLALWARLQALHVEWREGGEASSATSSVPAADELLLEHALRESLQRAARWRTTPEDRARLQALCLTDGCRQEFSRVADERSTVSVSAEEYDGMLTYRVGVLSLSSLDEVVEHLALYPTSTAVAWHAGTSHSPSRAKALYGALRTAAAERGIDVLAKLPPM